MNQYTTKVFLFCLILSFSADAEITKAEDFVERKEYSKALDELSTYYEGNRFYDREDISEINRGLWLWVNLSKSYQPAQNELLNFKHKLTTEVRSATSDSCAKNLLLAIFTINSLSQEGEDSVLLFQELNANNEKLAEELYPYVESELFTYKKYLTIDKYIKHPISRYYKLTSYHEKMITELQKIEDLKRRQSAVEHFTRKYKERLNSLREFFEETNRTEELNILNTLIER
ncbi:hypothetical protein LP316_11455 [Thalassotalea sp. LPB0316]|uniref:hypothetical protein n=1 Tax=Thalassotalea sp. LPB0316 TaxID=2769490 RepID=UPI001867F23D|nr:hypothetical protein [Thalassotalea sp. LPB0316]QOL24921.1 hypothetical protein LP316_11455 [Thalassotalea sp. LPB0316]